MTHSGEQRRDRGRNVWFHNFFTRINTMMCAQSVDWTEKIKNVLKICLEEIISFIMNSFSEDSIFKKLFSSIFESFNG